MQCSSTSWKTNVQRDQSIPNELAMVSYNGSAGMHGHEISRLTLLSESHLYAGNRCYC